VNSLVLTRIVKPRLPADRLLSARLKSGKAVSSHHSFHVMLATSVLYTSSCRCSFPILISSSNIAFCPRSCWSCSLTSAQPSNTLAQTRYEKSPTGLVRRSEPLGALLDERIYNRLRRQHDSSLYTGLGTVHDVCGCWVSSPRLGRLFDSDEDKVSATDGHQGAKKKKLEDSALGSIKGGIF
jgi:hypothetical protein